MAQTSQMLDALRYATAGSGEQSVHMTGTESTRMWACQVARLHWIGICVLISRIWKRQGSGLADRDLMPRDGGLPGSVFTRGVGGKGVLV